VKQKIYKRSSNYYSYIGAKSVLKTLGLKDDRSVEIEAFNADEIQSRQGLSRRDLIAAMLLLGSDFDSGVRLIGPTKARMLLRSLNTLFPPTPPSSAKAPKGEGPGGGEKGGGKRDKGDVGGEDGGGRDALAVVLRWMEGSDDSIEWVADPRETGARKPPHCGQCGQMDCKYKGKRTKECHSGAVTVPCCCGWCVVQRAFRRQQPLAIAKQRVSQHKVRI
jgi:hypothetical protein